MQNVSHRLPNSGFIEVHMPTYRYKARDKEGALHMGTMEARVREAVADQLSGQGFIPVLIEEQQQAMRLPDLRAAFEGVKSQDLIILSRQLATLVGAGVPFLSSLNRYPAIPPHMIRTITSTI